MERTKLQALSNSELLTEAKSARFREREAIAEVVSYLAEISARGVYRDVGYTSLFMYCRSVLQYSEAGAYRRVKAAEVMQSKPEVYGKLRDGSLTLCAIAEIARVEEQEAREGLLVKAEGKGKAEVARMVAPLLPPGKSSRVTVRVKSVETSSLPLLTPTVEREELHVVTMEVDEEFMALYRKAKELSGSVVPMTEVLKRALKEHVSRHEPKVKASRVVKAKKTTRSIPASVKSAVRLRDGGQCTFCSGDGKRCDSREGLEVDHIQPFAMGGTSDLDNLRLLCRSHNQLMGERAYGRSYMASKRTQTR